VDRQEFKNNFEVCDVTGAWLFSTTGCFNRHNRARAQEELSLRENSVVSFDYYRTDDVEESVLISYVAELQSLHIPIIEPTLEMYVLRNSNVLDVKETYIERLNEVVKEQEKHLA
jgi:hypothetical protein